MLSMSRTESVVFRWPSSACWLASQALAYDLDSLSQVCSIFGVTGT
jgi:hypothetical protein